MRNILDRIHARVGDLWWYSAMIFIACRSGDVIQAFIGLWLVPKYVGAKELGAVLPLQQLTSFLTVPLGIIAIVFSKQVNTYAAHGEYGKVKGFIRDVLAISSVLFLVCIAGAYFIMPFFYERLNIAPGLLTALILASGFVGSISSLVGAAQQGLKRFKMMSLNAILSAPVRLVTMLVAMPIRALSGYMLGQTTPGVVTTSLAALDIKKALAPYTPDHSWRKDILGIWSYLWPIAIFTFANVVYSTIGATIYRQRLPEVESAAYYMISRFAEITSYAGSTLSVVLIPLVSEAYETGKNPSRILRNSILGIAITSLTLAVIFFFFAGPIFNLTPIWHEYQSFAYLLPILTIITGLISIVGISSSYEIACRRFALPTFYMVFNLLWTAFLVAFTGYEFFRGILPDNFVDQMAALKLATLDHITWASLVAALLQILALVLFFRPGHDHTTVN